MPFPNRHFVIKIVIIIIAFLSVLFLYIRLKFKFWREQPVFHVYDLHYYIFPPGIIKHELPEKNKYCNFNHIETQSFATLSKLKITQFVNFIQIHYLQNKDNIFRPKTDNIVPYMTGHNFPSFMTTYYEDELLLDTKTNTSCENKRIVSVMTARPVHIRISIGIKKNTFDAYYVDYLCVDKAKRKQGIAEQMIQTHEYNQRHSNKEIAVSLFKREGELTGIVPLCVYTNYCFSMKKWHKPADLIATHSLIDCNQTNLHYFIDFLENVNSSRTRTRTATAFDIIIMSDMTNIVELIKTNNIFVYMILEKDTGNIICVYFFRKSCTFIEKGHEVLSCFASITSDLCNDPNMFTHGFKVALWKIKERNPTFRYLAVENISHNQVIIDNLRLMTAPCIEMPCAYFFYNFAYSTFVPKKVLIVV